MVETARALRFLRCGIFALTLAEGCTALGWRFGPGFSSADTALFARPPVIVHRGGSYVLSWTYGSIGFFFRPEYRPRNGRLVFSLQATTSSGSLRGQPSELPIDGDEAVLALSQGGACWWEPNGECVAIPIVDRGASEGP